MRSRRDMRFPLGRSFVRSLAGRGGGKSISHLLQQLLLMVLELPHLRSALVLAFSFLLRKGGRVASSATYSMRDVTNKTGSWFAPRCFEN